MVCQPRSSQMRDETAVNADNRFRCGLSCAIVTNAETVNLEIK